MRTRVVILVLTCLVVASCVSMQRPPLERRLYALETVRPGVASGPALSPEAVLVRRLAVSPRAAGRELVYRTGDSAWTSDYYNLYFVRPADMLSQDLRAWLAASGLFAEVLDPGSLAASGYVLEGNVTALYGDYAAKPSQAVAEMQFLLLKNVGSERKILLSRDYRAVSPLADARPQTLVLGLRAATARIYADLEADLRAALKR